MIVADNYGSKWVKGILNWFREKTLKGKVYSELIIEATLECGLRRNKTVELVNEFVETGLLEYKDNSIFWVNSNYKPTEIDFEKEKKRKPRKKKDEEKKESIEDGDIITGVDMRYVKYVEGFKKEDEDKILSYGEWIKQLNKNKRGDEKLAT